MNRTKLLYVVSFLGLLLSASCSRTINCSDGGIRICPVGFSATDFDSAKIVRYEPGGTFAMALDTSAMVYYNRYIDDTGTINAYGLTADNYFFVPKYDYKIFLPALGRTVAISNIKQTGRTQQSYSSGPFNQKLVVCYNSVVSASIDGNTASAADNSQYISLYFTK